MMAHLKKASSYLLASLVVVGIWWLNTSSENYAWFPKGKEQLTLDIALARIFVYKVFLWLILANSAVFGIKHTLRKQHKTGLSGALFAVAFYLVAGKWVEEKCAFSYYTVFLNQSVSEEYLQDPIKEAGGAIGPLLSASISNRKMKFRRYAISALGEIDYRPATPVLRSIVFDRSEPDYIRDDAQEVLTKFNYAAYDEATYIKPDWEK
jgi:hypothetical protein